MPEICDRPAFNPSARHDGQSGGSRPCCGCEKASALQAPGRYASRTGCCRSAPDFRPLTKCQTEVGTAHSVAYSRVCDRPISAAGLNKEDGSAIIKVFERMAGLTISGDE